MTKTSELRYAIHWQRDPEAMRTACGDSLRHAARVTTDVGIVDCQRCLRYVVSNNGSGYSADACGAGTEYGCKRPIADGERAHIVMHARQPAREGESPHVLFHVGPGYACCPCESHPERVEPYAAARDRARSVPA